MRPDWDSYFMEITEVVAKRSTCTRRQVGAILVRDKHILATGYNGAPKKLEHCENLGCLRSQLNIPSGERHELCRALHAEQNAIAQAARHGISVLGATMYVTHQPCSICAKVLINAGIVRIIYAGAYPEELSRQLLAEANIELVVLDK